MSAARLSSGAVRTGAEYEAARGGSLAALSLTQSDRRVALSDELALVFESGATLGAALEESLRVERGHAAEIVAELLTTFEALAPGDDALLATLIIDSADAATLADAVDALRETGAGLVLEVAGERVPAVVHPGEDLRPGALAVVFELQPQQRQAWLAGGQVRVVIDGAAGRRVTELSPLQRAAVALDLGVEAPPLPAPGAGDG